ncbi:MAG: hypothetical protein GY701_06230, partial [Sulfitobacter sp.]|nr:hypothetical protein [Sulfitobacter sp.]
MDDGVPADPAHPAEQDLFAGLAELAPDGYSPIQGQVFFLDFDGAEDVVYDGPRRIEDIDVPAFSVSTDELGSESAFTDRLIDDLNAEFGQFGIEFTNQPPGPEVEYSTIHVGGDDSRFSEYGSFFGLAEKVDTGNADRSDQAFVFSETIEHRSDSPQEFYRVLQDTIAHEAGHLLGVAHIGDETGQGPLAAVAGKDEVN